MNRFPMGKHLCNRTEPALNHFRVDSEGQNVQSRVFFALPPVRRGLGIQINAAQTLETQVVRSPDKLLGQQFLHEETAAEPVWRRANHRDQVRVSLCRPEHLLRLGLIHGHSGLAEDVLPRLQCRDCNCGVQIWRGPDPDNVDLGMSNELGPIAVGGGFRSVFLAKSFGTFVRRVTNRGNLDIWNFLQSRQMAGLDDASGSDESDTEFWLPR